uniref:EF-hand domain-containing protein n=1 Tax=Panagrolaimus sp. PS1159 TaxID=55785 RepID=A0AC35FVX0_9BILA
MYQFQVSAKQIIRLHKRFLSLDKDERGYISRYDLLNIPELAINPLGERIVDAFFTAEKECTDDGRMNFRQFINVLAHFRPINKKCQNGLNSRESKLRFAFSMYDLNKNNYITKEEFKFILHMMIGSNMTTSEQIDHIAERTLLEADLDRDGKISFEEFCYAMERTDINQKMSIRFLN